MKLHEIIDRFNENRLYEINISSVCQEYLAGIKKLREEDCYKKHRDDEVKEIYIRTGRRNFTEINIRI